MPSPILSFYAGGTDDRGRTLDDILAWDNARLEAIHDYIQRLFPLPEPSAFNASAPLLSAQDIAAFRDDPALQGRLLAAFRRMLEFYGFELGEDDARPEVLEAHGPAAQKRAWLTPGNHNMLRITRVLRCLTLLGLTSHARAFLAALERLYDAEAAPAIGAVTMRYWREAVTVA